MSPYVAILLSRGGWKRPEMAGKGRKWLDKLFPQGPGKPLFVLPRSSTITRFCQNLSLLTYKKYFEILKILLPKLGNSHGEHDL